MITWVLLCPLYPPFTRTVAVFVVGSRLRGIECQHALDCRQLRLLYCYYWVTAGPAHHWIYPHRSGAGVLDVAIVCVRFERGVHAGDEQGYRGAQEHRAERHGNLEHGP